VGFPALLAKPGGNQTRPDRPHKTWPVAELKQVIAEISRLGCAARRGSRGNGWYATIVVIPRLHQQNPESRNVILQDLTPAFLFHI
jgi:hypothetical protein